MKRVSISHRARAIWSYDNQADRIVPPTGFTAQLTVLASAAMALLAVFALAISVASGRLADRWTSALDGTATLRISAPADQVRSQTEAAQRVLETTSGIASYRVLSEDDMAALLAPWLGSGIDLNRLPVPQMIEIELGDAATFDAAGLRLRLAGEVPGAVLDDHGRWREPLAKAATRLRMVSWGAALIIFAAVAAMVTLAAQAALAANAQVIAVLRLVGATDQYIAMAFVRRFTMRALTGAATGAFVATITLVLIPSRSDEAGLLNELGFSGWNWFLPVGVPILSGCVALIATARAAQSALRGLT